MRLKNPPLVEVIFEMHWQFAPTAIGVPYKTPYRLLVESLYEALKGESATLATLLKWLDEAHARIEECFFRMIEGELRRQFEQ